jgi:hypothetical protein
MTALDLLKTFLSGGLPMSLIPHLKLDHWTGSYNGSLPLAPITEAKLGLKNGTDFWAHFTFEENGAGHVIDCTRPLTGGAASIQLDGQDRTGHVTFATHLTAFPAAVKLEIDVVMDTAGRYRFDAKVEG